MLPRNLKSQPLYSFSIPDFKAPETNIVFERIEFDPESIRLLEIGIKNNLKIRYAVVIRVMQDEEKPWLFLSCRPGESSSPSDEEKAVFLEHFSKPGEHVKAISAMLKDGTVLPLTGSVHSATISLTQNLILNKRAYSGYLGLSFTLTPTGLSWLNRSSLNSSGFFRRNSLALDCLAFAQDDYSFPFDTSPKLYTTTYHLERCCSEKFLQSILPLIENYLKKNITASSGLLHCYYIPESCYFDITRKWEKVISKTPEEAEATIRRMLMKSLYTAASLRQNEEAASVLNIQPFGKTVRGILDDAKAEGIPLDVDAIPKRFAKEAKGATALIRAAKKHDYSIIQILINAGADLNKTDENGDNVISILFTFIKGSKSPLEELEKLHTTSPVLFKKVMNAQDDNRNTLLFYVVRHLEELKKLHKTSPVVFKEVINAQDDNGNTLLFYAVQHCNIKLIMYLVEQNASAGTQVQKILEGVIRLFGGAGYYDDVRYILSRYKEEEKKGQDQDSFKLIEAFRDVLEDDPQIRSQWLQNLFSKFPLVFKYFVDKKDIYGRTVLLNLAKYARWDQVSWLMDKGISDKVTDEKGQGMATYMSWGFRRLIVRDFLKDDYNKLESFVRNPVDFIEAAKFLKSPLARQYEVDLNTAFFGPEEGQESSILDGVADMLTTSWWVNMNFIEAAEQFEKYFPDIFQKLLADQGHRLCMEYFKNDVSVVKWLIQRNVPLEKLSEADQKKLLAEFPSVASHGLWSQPLSPIIQPPSNTAAPTPL